MFYILEQIDGAWHYVTTVDTKTDAETYVHAPSRKKRVLTWCRADQCDESVIGAPTN